jgi:hypothetical protein
MQPSAGMEEQPRAAVQRQVLHVLLPPLTCQAPCTRRCCGCLPHANPLSCTSPFLSFWHPSPPPSHLPGCLPQVLLQCLQVPHQAMGVLGVVGDMAQPHGTVGVTE